MSSNLVTVIIPIFNGEKYLEETINSVIQQTLQPCELFLVDDGSTDGSIELIHKIQTPFPKKILTQENKYQSAARNLAASKAVGKYLAFLDHDDIWYPRHIEKLVSVMEADQRLAWSYTDIDEIDETGGFIDLQNIKNLSSVAEHPKSNLINMLSDNLYIFPSACVVRTDAFLSVGGFDERLSGYEDDDLFLRLYRAGWLNAFVPESGVKYRRFVNSCAFSEKMWQSREIFAQKLMENFPDDYELKRYYIRDIIAPRFYNHAREEYWRHFPLRRWDLCKRAVDLMQRFSDLSHDPRGLRRMRRNIALRIMARPKIFEHFYPMLSKITMIPRMILKRK